MHLVVEAAGSRENVINILVQQQTQYQPIFFCGQDYYCFTSVAALSSPMDNDNEFTDIQFMYDEMEMDEAAAALLFDDSSSSDKEEVNSRSGRRSVISFWYINSKFPSTSTADSRSTARVILRGGFDVPELYLTGFMMH